MQINIEKQIRELHCKYEAPSLYELQCLKLLMETFRPHAVEKINHSWELARYLTDQKTALLTIKDVGFMMKIFSEFGFNIKEYWIRIYYPKYLKLLKHNYKLRKQNL